MKKVWKPNKKGAYNKARKKFKLTMTIKAQYYLGVIYENGLGIKKDYKKAARYYWEASQSDIPEAQIKLGKMYQDGRGVKRNYNGALKWYKAAIKNCKEDQKSEFLDQISRLKKIQEEKSNYNVDLESSLIKSVDYDPHKKVLEIKFNNKAVYEYYNVPEYVYHELISAESHGQYANRNIFYSYRQNQINKIEQKSEITEDKKPVETYQIEEIQKISRLITGYKHQRLCFYSSVIEPLHDEDLFQVETYNHGTFRFTKAQFHQHFPNVVKSVSYKEHGMYHYPTIPGKALPFKIKNLE